MGSIHAELTMSNVIKKVRDKVKAELREVWEIKDRIDVLEACAVYGSSLTPPWLQKDVEVTVALIGRGVVVSWNYRQR